MTNKEQLAVIDFVEREESKEALSTQTTLLTLTDPDDKMPDIGMLLPERNYNQCLLDQISTPAIRPVIKGAFVGLFLADPFLHLPSTLPVLQTAGVRGIANFPSACFYGANFAKQLDEVGFSAKVEFEKLAIFQSLGLEALGCVHADSAEDTLARIQPSDNIAIWMMHGGLEGLFRSSVSPASLPGAPSNTTGDWFLYDPAATSKTLPASFAGHARARWWD